MNAATNCSCNCRQFNDAAKAREERLWEELGLLRGRLRAVEREIQLRRQRDELRKELQEDRAPIPTEPQTVRRRQHQPLSDPIACRCGCAKMTKPGKVYFSRECYLKHRWSGQYKRRGMV
jgi:hypothetical protein